LRGLSGERTDALPKEETVMLSSTNGAPLRRVLAIVTVFFLSLFAVPLFADDPTAAQPPTTEKKDAPDIIITATRTSENALNVPQAVAVITADEIERSGRTDVAQVISEKTGIALYETGPSGSTTQVWMRGSKGARVLVLIDGVPGNNANDGVMDLSLIPVAIIDRIEIVFGGASVMYGSNALNGVINIITKKGAGAGSSFSVKTQTTSFLPQADTAGATTNSPDPLSLLDRNTIAADGGYNAGFFSFFLAGAFAYDRNEYYYDQSGETDRRANAEHLGGNGFLNLAVPWATGSLAVNGTYTRSYNRLPGDLTWLTPRASQLDERIQASASFHEDRFFSELLTLDLKASYTRHFREYRDPDSMWTPFSSDTVHSFYADASQKWNAADWLALVYGGSFTADVIDGTTYGEKGRVIGSGFLSLPLTIAGELTVSPAARIDFYSDFGPEITYACGFVLPVTPVSSVKASFAKSFRAPTFGDLYYPGLSNPTLKPEEGYGGEIGYSLADTLVKFDVSVYVRYMVNEIGYVGMTPENIDHSLYPGLDARLAWNFFDAFYFEPNVSLIYSFDLAGGKNLADDTRVRYAPIYKVQACLAYRTEGTTLSVSGDLTGERFTGANNTNPLPPFFILNASWRQKLGQNFFLTLALDNLLNHQYQVIMNYPMPGIALRWGIELKL
jgi:vitamin B12 transporter